MSGSDRRTLLGAGLAGVAGTMLGSAPARADDGNGPLTSATISFGSWMLPLDRFPNLFPRLANHHVLCPSHVTVKRGGCVNFVIAGLHNVQIFEPGKTPGDVQSGLTVPMTGPAPFTGLPLINDPVGRVYRGPDPSLLPLERIEAVQLTKPGTYLVICGFLFHFQDNMFGWVKVVA